MITIGDQATGKTCCINRYTDNQFNEANVSTMGVGNVVKNIKHKGKNIKLQVFDTAGQDRFASLTTGYYKNAQGVVIMYDVTSKKSFTNIDKWLSNVNDNCIPDVIKILAANKCDLVDEREITPDQGKEQAKRFNLTYLESSAKTNIGIEEMFGKACRDWVDQQIIRESNTSEFEAKDQEVTKAKSVVINRRTNKQHEETRRTNGGRGGCPC